MLRKYSTISKNTSSMNMQPSSVKFWDPKRQALKTGNAVCLNRTVRVSHRHESRKQNFSQNEPQISGWNDQDSPGQVKACPEIQVSKEHFHKAPMTLDHCEFGLFKFLFNTRMVLIIKPTFYTGWPRGRHVVLHSRHIPSRNCPGSRLITRTSSVENGTNRTNRIAGYHRKENNAIEFKHWKYEGLSDVLWQD